MIYCNSYCQNFRQSLWIREDCGICRLSVPSLNTLITRNQWGEKRCRSNLSGKKMCVCQGKTKGQGTASCAAVRGPHRAQRGWGGGPLPEPAEPRAHCPELCHSLAGPRFCHKHSNPCYWGSWREIHCCVQHGLYLIFSFIVEQLYKHKVFIYSFTFEHV